MVPMKPKSMALELLAQNCQSAAGEEPAFMTEEAFAEFYRQTVRPLHVYLARASGSDTLAEDLVQESYLRFLGARVPWKGGADACRRYLFRIGTNLLRDHWRRPGTSSLEDLPDRALPSEESGAIDRMDSEALLAAAFRHLRPIERQLLWLAHAEGCSHREIADITRLGRPRIRLTLFRSRHKLAQALRREMGKSGGRT